MKKYLFIALAALGLVACADNGEDNIPAHNGELEESYIAINLMSADVNSRAATDSYGYEYGTDAERAIHSAHFFFFDEDGEPFNVNQTNAPATAPGGTQNHLQLAINEVTGSTDDPAVNISDISEAVLVLNTYKGVYPSQIVAVLNWTPTPGKAYSLDELHGLLATLGNDANGYVMSNSVYMDGAGKVVDAVPLTAANIKTNEVDAKAAPVEIYVERTAAKVVLTASKKIAGTDNIFSTQKPTTPILSTGGSSTIDVYVKLLGWELYNDYGTTNLLKNIDTAWTPDGLGLTWNDIPYRRCYWAESQDAAIEDSFSWSYTADAKAEKGFLTDYGFGVADDDDDYATRSTYTYCGENTNQVDGTTDPRTKVILKGQLMQKDGETAYKPLALARWYGTEYAGEEALKIAVANSLKYTLYYKDGENYVSIEPEHIECVAGVAGAKSYEVGFNLSTQGAAETWYQYSSEKGYQEFGDLGVAGDNVAKANAYLETVEPALLYAEGQTYYIVDIRHLGTDKTKPAYYGVVRNHVYQIDIESIKGYGSPVYIGTSNIVTPPEYPVEDESSYVAARINVLSWKVVKQGVNVGN